MIYLDHTLALIDAQLAAPCPERGGVLLGTADSPMITDAILDPSDRQPARVWQMHAGIATALHAREKADPEVRLIGTIHSHPVGLDRPSAQDVVATRDLLHRNPSMGRAQLHIVTRWEDLPSGAADALGDREIGLAHGKVSCFEVFAGDDDTAGARSAWSRVMPVHEHALALAEAIAARLTGIGTTTMDGITHATAVLTTPCEQRLQLLTPPGYPTVAPTVLLESADGDVRLIPVEWDQRRSGSDRLLGALDLAEFDPAVDLRDRQLSGPGTPSPAGNADESVDAPEEAIFTARVAGPLGGSVAGLEVVVFGLGSVGSTLAESLARTGVDRFTVVDPETVSIANLSRTVYDRSDVDRPKTAALADHLQAVVPAVRVRPVSEPIQALPPARLRDLVAGAAVVVAATDDPEAQARINAVSFATGVPAVFVGLYAGASAGEVILTVPGHTSCYRCAAPVRQGQPGRPTSDYGTGRLNGEPALGCDIGRVVAMGTRMVLALLATQTGADTALTRQLGEVLAQSEQFLLTSTEPRWGLFERLLADVPGQHGFASAWMQVTPNPDCQICGDHPASLEVLLGSPDVAAMAAALASALPTASPAEAPSGSPSVTPSGEVSPAPAAHPERNDP